MEVFGRICLVLLVAASLNLSTKARGQKSGQAKGKTGQEQIVVFVCEHGVAKSVIAAAHFNRLAHERNLNIRAIARGTNPEDEIPSNVVTGLQADGLAPGEKSKQLSEADVVGTSRVVAFCKLPEKYYQKAAVEEWDDVPPVSEDYLKAREAILDHVKRLLDELQRK
jgi:protein-tyrosine-phosphatase